MIERRVGNVSGGKMSSLVESASQTRRDGGLMEAKSGSAFLLVVFLLSSY